MDRFILRLFRFLNRYLDPDEGWGVLLALLAALFVLASAVKEGRWVRNAPEPYIPVAVAALLGLILAKRLRQKWAALAWAASGGLLFTTLTAARAWPSLTLIAANIRYGWSSLRGLKVAPVVPLGVWLVERLNWWSSSMSAWAQAMTGGRSSAETAPVVFAMLLIIWAVGVWAGWMTFRRHQALLALTPAGVALATHIFLAAQGLPWLMFFLAAMLILTLMLRYYTLRRHWDEAGIDYAPQLQIEFYVSGLTVALVAVLLMPMLPTIQVRPISRAFWRLFNAPITALENRTQAAFPDLERLPRSLIGGGAVAGGGLPRAHLLGGNPELAEREILRVRTSDADAADPAVSANYRWRGLTFAAYNGRGWDLPGAAEIVRFDPGEIWITEPPASRRPLRQVFEFSAGEPYWLYAAGDAVAADRAARAHLRAPGDVIGLDIRARNYIAISQTPAVMPEALRTASLDLSPVISDTYLALPDSVPDRVFSLAREVVAAADNPYDQAKAIEAYLRHFPYNLDIPEPPPDVDITDYFLFTLQQGYCDYYATTMIVMARSVGLPARLAVGYAAGRYDPAAEQFIVTEADAHSWPEIYFPGYGWIPFEPTAAQPVFTYQLPPELDAQPQETAELDLAAELAALRWRAWFVNGVLRWGLSLLAGLLLLVGIRAGLSERRLRQRAADPWQLAYLRLEAWGRRLGVPPADWYTAREYAARWRQKLRQSASPPAAEQAISRLSHGLEQRQYAPVSARPADAEAIRLWRGLRRQLRRQFWRRQLARWLRIE